MIHTSTASSKSNSFKVVLLFCYFLLPIGTHAQQFEWVQTLTSRQDGYFPFLSTDKLGNSFLLTNFRDSITVGNKVYKVARENSTATVLVKYNEKGNILWSNFINVSYISRIASDQEGNTYLVISIFSDITINSKVYPVSKTTHEYLFKFDPQGNLVYYKPLYNMLEGITGRLYIDLENNVYITGWFETSITFDGVKLSGDVTARSYIAKYNKYGKLAWVRKTGGSGHPSIAVDINGNVYTTGSFSETTTFDNITLQVKRPLNFDVYDSYICKYDKSGKFLWVNHINQTTKSVQNTSISVDILGNIYVTGSFRGQLTINKDILTGQAVHDAAYDIYFAQFNSQGKPVYGKRLGLTGSYRGNYVFADVSQDVYWSGEIVAPVQSPGYLEMNSRNVVMKLSRIGELKWEKHVAGTGFGISTTAADAKGNVYSTGYVFKNAIFDNDTLQVDYFSHLFISKLKDTTFIPNPSLNTISGKVFHDVNANCKWDAGEEVLANQFIKAEPNSYYTSTDSSGSYKLYVTKGTYTVSQIQSTDEAARQIKQTCPDPATPYSVTFNSYGKDTTGYNFANEITKLPFLTVEIAADRRRRCFRNTTTVQYSNKGYASVSNVQVKLYYPSYVLPLNANIPWLSKKDSILTFNLGTLLPGQSGVITLTDSVVCGNEAIRGLTQCVKAVITPKNNQPSDPRWDKSDLELKALCKDNGFVRLAILNSGQGHMADSSAYRIYLDANLIFESKYKLNSQDSLVLEVPVNGKTIRLEADLSPYHPDHNRQPSITLEGCGSANDVIISKGFVNQLAPDDGTEQVAVSCLPILDSFDPNDKLASPQGVGEEHLITNKEELEYLIRFQNTGTDLAFNVIIQDTLDDHLDISTLRMGTSSHPFGWKLSGTGKAVITWAFKNINLPDHKTNERNSHGFVRFRIRQKAGNTLGTKITNQAAIIFDYNSPVITNLVTHQIGVLPVNSTQKVEVDLCKNNYPTLAQAGAMQVISEISKVNLAGNYPLKGRGQWRVISGKGIFEDSSNPLTTVSELGVGKNVFEWSINKCDSTSRSQVTIERVVIPSSPIALSPDPVCPGLSLPLLSTNGNSVAWYADKDLKSLLHQGASYQPVIDSTTTFYVTQTVDGYQSAPTAVHVIFKSRPDLPSIQSSVSYCAGEIIQPLTAIGANIQWYADATLREKVATGNTFQPVIETTTQLYVTQSVNGCESKPAQITITIKPLPAPPVVESPEKLYCEGENIAPLTAIGENIRWYNDQEGNQLLIVGETYQSNITTSTNFYVTQTIDGCEGIAQLVVVQIQPANISLQTSGDTLIAPLGDTYQWYFEGMLLPKASGNRFIAKNTGHYQVILHNKQCVSTSEILYHSVIVTSSYIKLSPNPAVEVLNMELIAAEIGTIEVSIRNQLGQQLKSYSIDKKYNQLEHNINIGQLPQGMYIIEVSMLNKKLTAKFIKK